jgi:aquaporin Z
MNMPSTYSSAFFTLFPNNMKKYLAEAIGTMVLVLMGCGAAAIAGATNAGAIGRLGVALSFGLAVLIMIYAI